MTGESRSSGRRVKRTERRQECLILRKGGATYQQIADTLGVSPQRAHKIVTQELAKIQAETAEEAESLRTLELERLDSLFLQCFKSAQHGDLPAVDRCLRIMERRAKLLGLDMPVKIASTDSEGRDLLVSREWLMVRGVILEALEGAPKVKAKVIEALGELETRQPLPENVTQKGNGVTLVAYNPIPLQNMVSESGSYCEINKDKQDCAECLFCDTPEKVKE